MRVIFIVLLAITFAKLVSLIYFASKTKSFKAPGQIDDIDSSSISEKMVSDEIKNDTSDDDNDVVNSVNSDALDELLVEPIEYDDTVDDNSDGGDQGSKDVDPIVQTEPIKGELVLQETAEKADVKTEERELEQVKKVAEPVTTENITSNTTAKAANTTATQAVKTLREGVDFVKENGVIVATDDNFQDLVRHFKYTFIDFYAEWCGWCRELEPQFAETARLMRKINPDVGFIKINLTRNKAVKKAYKIHKFPTVVLFNRMVKKTTTFKYSRTPLVMARWIQKTLKEQGSIK